MADRAVDSGSLSLTSISILSPWLPIPWIRLCLLWMRLMMLSMLSGWWWSFAMWCLAWPLDDWCSIGFVIESISFMQLRISNIFIKSLFVYSFPFPASMSNIFLNLYFLQCHYTVSNPIYPHPIDRIWKFSNFCQDRMGWQKMLNWRLKVFFKYFIKAYTSFVIVSKC